MEADDLDIIARAMHSMDIDVYVSPDGNSLAMSAGGYFVDDDEPEEDWWRVPRAETAEEYDDMVAFTDSVGDRGAQARLRAAMAGSGAFRRFRQAVHNDPTEVGTEWGAFQDARQELRALEWLGEEQLMDTDLHAALVASRHAVIHSIEARLRGIRDREIQQVLDLERQLQRPATRQDRRRLEDLLAPNFTEIGASGQRRSRAQMIDAVLAEDPDPIHMHDSEARRIADDVVLIQWVSERAGVRAFRTSLWCRSARGWQLSHHQGTPLG